MTEKRDDTVSPLRFLVVTGLSGAGMSTALKSLEDMGYEVFDNFPLTLVRALAAETDRDAAPVAIGIDARTRGFDAAALTDLARDIQARLVFITCDESVLAQRFTETRRRHPMAKDRPAPAGIKREQEMLFPLRAAADVVIDTSLLSPHELRRVLGGHFDLQEGRHMTVSLVSFGFRYGLPREADIVMDARFLRNPYWEKDLRGQTGLDAPVGNYVAQDADFQKFIAGFKALLIPLLPRYRQEGKSYLTLAVGCTGGRHRSVYAVETLALWLKDQGFPLTIIHRDIER